MRQADTGRKKTRKNRGNKVVLKILEVKNSESQIRGIYIIFPQMFRVQSVSF